MQKEGQSQLHLSKATQDTIHTTARVLLYGPSRWSYAHLEHKRI